MLEATQHASNSFITLTYADDKLPRNGDLEPAELQRFIKRLRKKSNKALRYFACGEYGSRTARPHYHLALFGQPNCERGRTAYRSSGKCCEVCDQVMATWGQGAIDIAPLEIGTASYVAGYVAKKWTRGSSDTNREPEFTRMSLRPGLGLNVMHDLASTLLQYDLHKEMIDVPLALAHGTHEWPLGKYLRRKLRSYIGRSENAPQTILDLQAAELHDLRQAAWDNATSLTSKVLEQSLGRRIQIEARHRRRSREKV